MTTALSDRFAREIEHFDRVYAEEERSGDLRLTEADKRRYAHPPADTAFSKEYYFHLLGPLRGRRVLEIACGGGVDTCLAAHHGAEVSAYDLSEAAIRLTRERAKANGVAERLRLQVCGSVDDAFRGERFDIVMGFAALHHLPLERLGEQIRARLNPGGAAVFVEPVVNSRALDMVRKMIPYRPVDITEDEAPLNDEQIARLAAPFKRVERREFECVARLYRLFPDRALLVRSLFTFDRALMRIPALRRFASVVVFKLHRDG